MNPFLDRPASYVAESQKLSCFLRALTIPLVVVVLHLLLGCEMTTTYHPDGTRTVTRKVQPEAIDAIQVHYLVTPQK